MCIVVILIYFKDTFEVYERDIEKLIKESDALKDQNLKIVTEIQQYHGVESRTGVITDHNLLTRKHNHLIKQYSRAVRQLNERDEEINTLRKKDRLFTVERRMADTVQNKTESIRRKLESQEDKNRTVTEKIRQYEQQNENLRAKILRSGG